MLDSIVDLNAGKDLEKGLGSCEINGDSDGGALVQAGTPVPSHAALAVPLTPTASSHTARWGWAWAHAAVRAGPNARRGADEPVWLACLE